MELEEFRQDLRNQVAARAQATGDYTADAFMREVADRLVEAGEVENLDVLNFSGTGTRQRKLAVNGADLNDGDESVALAVLHFTGGVAQATLTYTAAVDSLKTLTAFLEDALSGEFLTGREASTAEYQLAQDLHLRKRPVRRYRLYLITDSVLSGRAKALDATEINGVPTEFHVWDLGRLHQVSESSHGREELLINLTEWKSEGVPALRVSDTAGDLTTYLAALPGKLVADLYARYGSRLLEGNVRSFLSVRGKTNQGIRRTILNDPAHFLAYNNGISATASQVDMRDDHIISIRDLQIVNGGQTTASLFYTDRDVKDADLSNVYLQMKLVVVEPETASEMIPLISRFTNSQNSVSEADFFSNNPFHVQMEALSKRILAPARAGTNIQTHWYYERTRGQHQNDRNRRRGEEQRTFDARFPRNQVITKTDAAKYEVSWAKLPHQVSAGAQKNFRAYAELVADKFKRNEQEFQDTYFKELVAKAILFQSVRTAIMKSDWYESGQYLANLTTYAIAKLSYEISKEPRAAQFSLLSIWERQGVSEAILREAVNMAELALIVLTSRTRPTANVTEWAKKDACWRELADKRYRLCEEFLFECLPVRTNAAGNRAVTVNSRFSPKVSPLSHVKNVKTQTWRAAMVYLRENGKLTSPEQRALKLVVPGPTPGYIPQDDAFALLKILVKAENMGFKAN